MNILISCLQWLICMWGWVYSFMCFSLALWWHICMPWNYFVTIFVNPSPEQHLLRIRFSTLKEEIEHKFADDCICSKLFRVPANILRRSQMSVDFLWFCSSFFTSCHNNYTHPWTNSHGCVCMFFCPLWCVWRDVLHLMTDATINSKS